MSLRLSETPEQLREQFSKLTTREDVARLLDVDESRLIYYLYIVPFPKRYTSFQIPKKSGGVRNIMAPATPLKIIQQKLNQVFQCVYQPKATVHGFTHDRGIVSNAKMHAGRRYVLNLDLQDFFPSINFGRVRGMLMAPPYGFSAEVATVLAQICCFDNQLPQGAPTSPIVSNMLCAKLDSQLRHLAEKYRCIYTRYADDISFSTNMRQFPPALARISERTGQLEIGVELNQVIGQNGFRTNSKKLRLQTKYRRQEVTGLTTNRFPNVQRQYVRRIRAMLHAWEKFGLDAAEKEFLDKYCKKHRHPIKNPPSFKQVVKGRIEFLGMVKGKDDSVYTRFKRKLKELAPELVKEPMNPVEVNLVTSKPLIITEGKTDWKHLKAALLKLKRLGHFSSLDIEFQEYENPKGDDALLGMCKNYSEMDHGRKVIFIFDRDKPNTVKQVSADKEHIDWGHGVFSFAIPVPEHRLGTPDVCIELYYKDSDLTRKDQKGRRLFLSNEFSRINLRHNNESLNCTDERARRSSLSVIDDKVFNDQEENVALPKSDFADYVANEVENFNDLDVSEFKKILEMISMIIKDAPR